MRFGCVMNNTAKHVLLVDDDESIVEPLRLAFEDRGHRVSVASDGTQALSLIERLSPDLVVLDLVMPRRSGFAVLDRIADFATRRPRIMMVTANAELRYRQVAADRGVDTFIAKPYDIAMLLDEAESLLQAVT